MRERLKEVFKNKIYKEQEALLSLRYENEGREKFDSFVQEAVIESIERVAELFGARFVNRPSASRVHLIWKDVDVSPQVLQLAFKALNGIAEQIEVNKIKFSKQVMWLLKP